MVLDSLVFWLPFMIALVLAVWWGIKQAGPKTRRFRRGFYGTYDDQMEFDLRLTYKRFKELYPFSQISYQDYKKLQMERAFKRAVSSEKNKRMVR
jgi:hypothetical protein